MNKFIPNLAQLCFILRPLLEKDKQLNGDESHEDAFKEINKQAQKSSRSGTLQEKRKHPNNL